MEHCFFQTAISRILYVVCSSTPPSTQEFTSVYHCPRFLIHSLHPLNIFAFLIFRNNQEFSVAHTVHFQKTLTGSLFSNKVPRCLPHSKWAWISSLAWRCRGARAMFCRRSVCTLGPAICSCFQMVLISLFNIFLMLSVLGTRVTPDKPFPPGVIVISKAVSLQSYRNHPFT